MIEYILLACGCKKTNKSVLVDIHSNIDPVDVFACNGASSLNISKKFKEKELKELEERMCKDKEIALLNLSNIKIYW